MPNGDGNDTSDPSASSAAGSGNASRNFSNFEAMLDSFKFDDQLKRAFQGINLDFDKDTLAAGAGLLLAGSFKRVRKLAGDSVDLLESVGSYGRRFYDPIQEAMGGLQNLSNIANESVQAQYDALNQIYDAFNESGKTYDENFTALQVRTATASGIQVNALQAYFRMQQKFLIVLIQQSQI